MKQFILNIPQLRYLFYYIKKNKRVAYIKYAKTDFIESLWQVALNLLYSNKNGIKLTKSQIQLLHHYRVALKRLVSATSTKDKKRHLTNNVIDVLLTLIIPWIAKNKLA